MASLTAGGVMVLQAEQDVVLEAAKIRQTGWMSAPGLWPATAQQPTLALGRESAQAAC